MILTKVKNEVGATAIEYGLIASLVAVVAVSGMSAVGGNLSNTYCTISKHLGGSGTCSGSVSSGTGNVSLANGGSLTDLEKYLKENLDKSLIDVSQGGTAEIASGTWFSPNAIANPIAELYLSKIERAMENINSSDPITNVFGLYNTETGNPINDYNSALDGINNRLNATLNLSTGHLNSTISSTQSNLNAKGIYNDNSGVIEVTTQSGKVYALDGGNGAYMNSQGYKYQSNGIYEMDSK